MSTDLQLNKSQLSDLTTIKKQVINQAKGKLDTLVALIFTVSETFKSETWKNVSVREFTASLASLCINDEKHEAGLEIVSKSTIHRYIRVSALLTEAKLDSKAKITELMKLGFTLTRLVDIDRGKATIAQFKALVDQAKAEGKGKICRDNIDGFIDTHKQESTKGNKKEVPSGDPQETSQNGEVLNGISIDTLLTRIFQDVASGVIPQEVANGSIGLLEAFNLAVYEVAMNVDNFITEQIVSSGKK